MDTNFNHKTNLRLDNGAYINLGAFIFLGIEDIFNFLPVVLLTTVIVISLFNFVLTAYFLRDLNKQKDLLDNYKRARNSSIRIMLLALGLIIVPILKLSIS